MSSTALPRNLELRNYIDGEWHSSKTTEFLDLANPATGGPIGRTPLSTPGDVDAAVRSASAAFPSWRRTPPGERIQYLFRLKNLLEAHIDEIARVITVENGKTS
jgi:malonate-semialdehyde dehydrogenase (acetylating) / methylmalonate-semialdehyde dehydrogenase